MDSPNIHFQDFPIEFKEINPSDFKINNENSNGFNVPPKVIIEPNEAGFIYESLINHIHLDTKDTTVINAPVGYGKSYAIIKSVEKIYNEFPNSLIIIAAPFVSLVEQYANDIETDTEIPSDEIYDYSNLGRNNTPYLDKRIQIVTVNSLIGNPGEDAFKNSEIKREYLNDLVGKCHMENRKVFFIYDEIHDAIQNFKEEYIFNLWKWKDVIQKNFIISATFNEASTLVIEYLAELTDRNIFIIESVRRRFPAKQSSLHLHFSSEHDFTENTKELVSVVEKALKRNRNIDILSYSKKLAKSIIEDKVGIGKKLKDRFEEINDCTSPLVSNQRVLNEPAKNRYDNTKCNVGTNFKTGVSIKKPNHTFIIILPPRATRSIFKNKYGIFSGGINSVIQALARQRNKGEIHIILPKPDKFDYDSLINAGMSDFQIDEYKKWYSKINDFKEKDIFGKDIERVSYLPVNNQNELIEDFYTNKLKANLISEINYIKNLDRTNLSLLNFPTYDQFKLNKGEIYLANTYKFFGKDIAAYVTYCAFTNQFINCNLTDMYIKATLFFVEDSIQIKLMSYMNKYFDENYYNNMTSIANFNMFYSEIRKEIYSQFNLKYKRKNSNRWISIKPFSNKNFENQLLRFCGISYFRKNYYYQDDFLNRNIDVEYTRSSYFLDCISVANTINLEEVNFSESNKNTIKAFQNLSYFRNKLINSIEQSAKGKKYNYLPIKPFKDFFNVSDIGLISETINLFIENDELIKNDVFNYIKQLPNPNRVINLLIPSDFNSEFMNEIYENLPEGHESFESYQESLNSLLN
ncbi:hypothetical protein BWK58_12690 [Flavobacterium columnare]|nr:hypothetical protein BWK58_12690 [Flavobacterium columnare]